MRKALTYAETHPLMTLHDYPYTAETWEGECKYNKKMGAVSVLEWGDIQENEPSQIKAALNVGPVSAGIDSSSDLFMGYLHGVITGTGCGTDLDHGIVIVGYGQENGVEYFLVKNSFGVYWGDNGYVKIGIEKGDGVCGINTDGMIVKTN